MTDPNNEKLKLIIDLAKWFVSSVVIVIVTMIIDRNFKERNTGLEEMKAFDNYVDHILKADNIEERWKLCEFFSTVTPTERLRDRWMVYRDTISDDYARFLDLKEEERRLTRLQDSLNNVMSIKGHVDVTKTDQTAIQLKEVSRKLEPFNRKLVESKEEPKQ